MVPDMAPPAGITRGIYCRSAYEEPYPDLDSDVDLDVDAELAELKRKQQS